MNVKLPAFMQCTACEVAYTSGRFCPTCNNKLAAVAQTTFPVVAAPPRVAAGAHAEAPAAPAPDDEAPAAPAPVVEAPAAPPRVEAPAAPPRVLASEPARLVAAQLASMMCLTCEATYTSGYFCPTCNKRLVVVEQPMQRAVAGDVEAPAAPAFDTAASVAQGRDCLARCRAAALQVPFVRSHFYATMLASRVEGHRRASLDTMERDSVPDAEARLVIDTLAPDFQALAAAELLGDAARALTRDEIAAQLAQLGLGEADDVAMES